VGIPRTRWLPYSPWKPLGIPSTISPLGQLYQSPPWPIPGDLGRGPTHQSHVLKHRDTYGQAQVCSRGHQESCVDHPCQPSSFLIKFWHVRNLLPQSIRLRLNVLESYWAARESENYPRRPQMEKKELTHLSLPYSLVTAW